MIYTFDKFEDFQAKARELGIMSDLQKLQNLDIVFYEQYPEYVLFSLVSFESGVNKITILTKDDALIYPSLIFESDRIMKIKVKGSYRESTIAAYTALKKTSDNYQTYFEGLNREIARAADTPSTEKLDMLTRRIRRLQDIVDDYTALLIRLKESEVPFVDTRKIGYEFDILLARTKHLAHRCAIASRDISRLYTITEMKYSKDLNSSIRRLTDAMLVLTVATFVVSIPNTIATIFGIPLVSDASSLGIVFTALVIGTILSLIISLIYLRLGVKEKGGNGHFPPTT